VLDAAELECVRGGRTLLRGLSFRLGGGELLRIAGGNGSGKTSLLRMLCGLLLPAHGEVRWKGEKIAELREDYSRQLVFLGHAPAVKDDLSAAENLSITCRIAGNEADEKSVEEALRRFGLPESGAPVKRLSQGQRRRAALARLALSASVPLWLLDEPLAALDTDAAKLAEAVISQHVAGGGMVVYTTHQEAHIVAAQTRVIDLGIEAGKERLAAGNELREAAGKELREAGR
jgi:heme exporter protein A